MSANQERASAEKRMWAIVIGINEYRSIQPPLKGAIADAEAMADFLQNNLGVPSTNIRVLKGPEATRQSIIDTFQKHFTENPEIKDGDPMVFFFAGHGTQSDAPKGWTRQDRQYGKMEALCPWDETVIGEQGRVPVYSIPDRTVWALLQGLARSKGNNITVILDCCHYIGGSRELGLPRIYHNSAPLPFEQDEEIWGPFCCRCCREGTTYIPGFRFGNMPSHVLLAACRQDELAHEFEVDGKARGNFTYQLLQTLREAGLQTTYADLVRRLPGMVSHHQHPQCEGNNKDCDIFTTKRDLKHTQLFKVTQNDAEGTLDVEAGTSFGVIPGTEFTIYLVNDSRTTPVAQMKAVEVQQASSTLTPVEGWTEQPFMLQSGAIAYARVSAYRNPLAELKVFFDVPASSTLNELVSRLSQHFGTQASCSEFGVYLTYNQDEADFIIQEEKGPVPPTVRAVASTRGQKSAVRMERTAKFLPIPGFSSEYTHVNVPNDYRKILFILNAAAHFKFHILRQNPARPLNNLVDLQLFRVTNTRNPSPDGNDLLGPTQSNEVVSSKVDLEFERDALYGMTIHNRSDFDLYPFLFVFDIITYQIYPWYKPAARAAAAPLRKGTTVTVGHSSHNADPIQFTLEDNEPSDTSFVKLFVSDQNTKLEAVEQGDVFEDISKMGPLPDPMSRDTGRSQLRKDIWGTQLVNITYTRS